MEYSRNLNNTPFFAILRKENLRIVENELKSIIKNSTFLPGKYLQFLSDEDEIKTIFNQNYFNYAQIDEYLSKSDIKRCWPESRSLFVSEKKEIIILINLADHFKIISFNKEFNSCYNNLVNILNSLGKSLKFETH